MFWNWGGKGKGEEKISIDLPAFYKDPHYEPSQDLLSGSGSDLLAGTPGEYYAPIGETGSPEFSEMSGRVTRDIQRTGEESAARMGIRGPAATAIINRQIADKSGELNFQDYLRSLEGKKYLLGQGRGMTEGVRGASLDMSNLKNRYNMNKAELSFKKDISNRDFAAKQQAEEDAMWGEMFGFGAQALGTIYGLNSFKPAGKEPLKDPFAMSPSTFSMGTAARGSTKIGGYDDFGYDKFKTSSFDDLFGNPSRAYA